jgi:hypothetical protein
MLKGTGEAVTVKVHRINPQISQITQNENKPQKGTRDTKRNHVENQRAAENPPLFLFFCAFCAFLWLTLRFQISRLRKAFATASVFECTCSF